MNLPVIRENKSVKGGEIVTRMLAAEGVRKVFGLVDGTYIGMFATFAKNVIDLITPRHETSAAHTAGAYARLTEIMRRALRISFTGRPGVVHVDVPENTMKRVADPAGLRGAIERSIASGSPAVIHVDVNQVKHMWAPCLKAFKDLHQEPKG